MEYSAANAGQRRAILRHHPRVVAQRLGTELVLVHLQTNQIYELNRTAARLWELLADGADRLTLHEGMRAEFDADRTELAHDVENLVSLMLRERLLTVDEPDIGAHE